MQRQYREYPDSQHHNLVQQLHQRVMQAAERTTGNSTTLGHQYQTVQDKDQMQPAVRIGELSR